jgi:hypothetical protein
MAALANQRKQPWWWLFRDGPLGNISGKEATRAFEKAGWQPICQAE